MTLASLDQQDTLAKTLLSSCREGQLSICCAESLTGGLLADAFVRVPGASDVFLGSVNTYAVRTKTRILGVDANFLEANGPVNAYTAEQMALGALRVFGCDGIALSTTGVAGPGPDGDISAGTFYVACALSDGRVMSEKHYCADAAREEVRRCAVSSALRLGSAQFMVQ